VWARGRLSSALARSRKARAGTDWVCELVFRPLAHVVVLALAPLRVPPPAVVLASGAAGVVGAVELARGHLVWAALLVQLKTVLDNADGQLARLTGRVTALGRYLDSEMDLVVDAALFAGLGWWSGHAAAALVGFLALTTVLSVNFNVERLYRGGAASPDGPGRATAVLRRVYALVYGPQDRLVERYAAWRIRRRGEAWNDRGTVAVLANLGMSPQLLVFGVLLALGRPLAFVWVALAELGLVAALALRREALARGSLVPEQEVT